MQPVRCAGCQALERRLDDLQAENERLRRQVDEATRARKRQAAPFAKGPPTDQPKRPGLRGFGLGWPLANGPAWRLPARRAASS